MVKKIDVSNELKKIQDAVYGEEVRSSIYDGIKKAADTTNLIIEEWTDVNVSMVSLKNNLEASEGQRVTNEETRKNQETLRQQNTSKAIQEINTVKNTVEQKLNDGEFIGASGVWLGDSFPTTDYDVWVKPTDIEGISGLFVRDNSSWLEISSIKGEKGSIPKHEVIDKKIRFENTDGSWGEWIDLIAIKSKDILTESGLTIQEYIDSVVDYPIETIETSTGGYEKWKSGKLIQWGRHDRECITSGAAKGGFYEGLIESVPYHIPFVGKNPYTTISYNAGTDFAIINGGYNASLLKPCDHFVLHHIKGTRVTFYYNYHSTGRWKV